LEIPEGRVSKAMSQNCNFLRDCRREGGRGRQEVKLKTLSGGIPVFIFWNNTIQESSSMCTNI